MGDTLCRPSPTFLKLLQKLSVSLLAAASNHSIIVTSHQIWACGDSFELGFRSEAALLRPVGIASLSTIIEVSCGKFINAVLLAVGEVYTFGAYNFGIEKENYCFPTKVHLSEETGQTITRISCGSKHLLCATGAGFVFSLGENDSHQLGNKDALLPSSIRQVKLPHQHFVLDVASGPEISAAVTIPYQPARLLALEKVLTQERNYLSLLFAVTYEYLPSLYKSNLLHGKDNEIIFGNIEAVALLECQFVFKLHQFILRYSDSEKISPIFEEMINEISQVYFTYMTNFPKAARLLRELTKHKAALESQLQKFQKSMAKKRIDYDLLTLLTVPINKPHNFLIILKQIDSVTPEDHEDKREIARLIIKLQDVLTKLKRSSEVGNLQSQVKLNALDVKEEEKRLKELMNPEHFVHKFVVHLSKNVPRERFLYLFKEVACICETTTLESPFLLQEVWVIEHSGDSNCVKMSTMEAVLKVYFKTKGDMNLFLDKVSKLINDQLVSSNSKRENGRRFVAHYFKGLGVYYGEVLDGCFDGEGKIDYLDKAEYKGAWQKGCRNGLGTLESKQNGWKYSGEWLDNREHGMGTYVFSHNNKWQRDKFEGEWKSGKPHGKGVMTMKNGDKTISLWKNGSTKFPTIYISKSKGTYYAGALNLELNQYNGFGILCTGTKERFYGVFSNGKRQGRGLLFTRDDANNSFVLNGSWNGNEVNGKASFSIPGWGKLLATFSGPWNGTIELSKAQLIHQNSLPNKDGFPLFFIDIWKIFFTSLTSSEPLDVEYFQGTFQIYSFNLAFF